MNISHLVAHYRAAKSIHIGIQPSLEDKLKHIERVFGGLPSGTSGLALVAEAKEAWPRCAPGTMKRYLVQLKAVLHRAERDGLIPKAPFIDLPYVYDTVYVDVSAEEVARLLDFMRWAEPEWYPLVLVLTQTGARLGEALALTPASYTRHGVRIVKVMGRRTKTVERIIPCTKRMQQAIDSGYLQSHEGLVPAGIAPTSVPTCLGRVLDDSTSALGLHKLRVHDLRHAFAAVLAEKGADLSDLTAALGHTNPAMSMRYRGLVKGRLTGVMALI